MIEFSGIVWRILFQLQVNHPLTPARAPEGRFHHSGQAALYASLTAEGAGVAIRRYIRPNDPGRVIVPLQVTAAGLADLRGQPDVSMIWQDVCATGSPAPTWTYSVAARDAGAQRMLYSSRSRPDLTHIVLFDPDAADVRPAGAPLPWKPQAVLTLAACPATL